MKKNKLIAAVLSALLAVACFIAPTSDGLSLGITLTAHAAQLDAPTPSREPGSYYQLSSDSIKLDLSCKQSGAKIYYSVNGGSYKQGSRVNMRGNSTIKTYAKYNGKKSKTVTYQYTVLPKVEFKTESGTDYYGNYTMVSVSSNPIGTKLYYTTDGTKPTTKSTKGNFGNGGNIVITLRESCTVRVMAVKDNYTTSYWEQKVTVAQNAVKPDAPTASLKAGEYNVGSGGSINTTLSCKTSGATIYYSVNGGSYKKYTGTIYMRENSTIKAYADNNGKKSDTVTFSYKLKPKVEFKVTSYTDYKVVRATSTPVGTKLYYTTDGTKPSTKSACESDSLYLKIRESCTLWVMAVKDGLTTSYWSQRVTIDNETPEPTKPTEPTKKYTSEDGKFSVDEGESVLTIDGVSYTGKANNYHTYTYDRFDIENFDGDKCIRIAQFENCVVAGKEKTIKDYRDAAQLSYKYKSPYSTNLPSAWITLYEFKAQSNQISTYGIYEYCFSSADVKFESLDNGVLTIRFNITYWESVYDKNNKRHTIDGYCALRYQEVPFQICTICDGTGRCQTCRIKYNKDCISCHGTRECKYCNGEGKKWY